MMSSNEFPVIPTGNPVIVHVGGDHVLGIVIGNFVFYFRTSTQLMYHVLLPKGPAVFNQTEVFPPQHAVSGPWQPFATYERGSTSA